MQKTETGNRQAGAEPIAGYRLIEPLGQGGFGQVWKCEAPGGVFKAIKFVAGADGAGAGPSAARQEFESLERVKTLRHPFILSLDRIEQIDGDLLVIMELADQSLHGLFSQYREAGEPGIPRDELIGYLLEAAEALDWMNFEHGLQHLDVKPHNLFVISGHVKVADFGLVKHLGEASGGPGGHAGVTPLYSAPELLRGTLSRHSDQYSLAVVYQQMLTGSVPFWHESVYELMMQHLSGEPDLMTLPEDDRAAVLRALSKVPEQRYPSCMEFVQALTGFSTDRTRSGSLRRSGVWRKMLRGARDTPPASHGHQMTPPSRPRPAPHEQPTQFTSPILTPPPVADLGLPAEAHHVAPTAISLPGYRFVSCLNQTPLGDLWLAEDAQGRRRRALALHGFVRYDARLIAHLQALRDPLLPATEVHWSSAERLILLTDCYEGTLRDRFEARQAEGSAGIPRGELIPLLRGAAQALDALYASHGILHLGVHPRNLLVDGERLRVADCGIIPLVWIPTGQPASALSGKYAAPELFGRRPSRSADQYSLALIYAEMLTGAHPRPNRPGGSGLHRRPGTMSGRSSAHNRTLKLDLDLLPVRDREVVARALSNDPERRYPSCVAFVDALEAAGLDAKAQEDRYHVLPPVIPFASLMGEPAAPDTVLPPVSQLVAAVVLPPDPRKVHGPHNTRYAIQPDGSWEYRCPLQLFPGAMKLKVAGFCQQWGAWAVRESGESFTLQLNVPVPRTFWERFKQPRRLEVDVQVEALTGQQSRLTEARVGVRYLSGERDQAERILATMAPQLFDSLRLFLQATPEQRLMDRWAFTAPLRVYPVLPDLELGPTLEGVCRDLSYGGVRFRVAQRPAVEQLYLHLYNSSGAMGYAVLARVTRVSEADGGVEIGARFVTDQGGR